MSNPEDFYKIMFDKSHELHKYFLDWRDKLFAGYIVVASTLVYFILTWVQKSENYNFWLNCIICLGGIIISFLLYKLTKRNTILIRECRYIAYKNEIELRRASSISISTPINDTCGLYDYILDDNGKTRKKNDNIDFKLSLNNHTGIINIFYILGFIVFFFLLIFPCLSMKMQKVSTNCEPKCIVKSDSVVTNSNYHRKADIEITINNGNDKAVEIKDNPYILPEKNQNLLMIQPN